jgi:uncharacterized membrane protein
MIQNPAGILAFLTGIAALFFYWEHRYRWRIFSYLPPLMFIYAIPVVLSNSGVIPTSHGVYDGLRRYGLPFFLTILLLDVDVRAAFRIMGRGVFVMLMGTLGVVVGAPVAYFIVHRFLTEDAWKGYGALAGSWIGGTGNMAAVAEGIGTTGELFGLAVMADTVVYLVWLPLMLMSRNWSGAFARFTGVRHEERLAQMEAAVDEMEKKDTRVEMRHVIYLGFIGFAVTWISVEGGAAIAAWLERTIPPDVLARFPVVSATSITVILVTTLGISLSNTPARKIPGSHNLAMAVVYLFVAVMGARASIEGFGQAVPFLIGAYIWIFIHGGFCLLGARLFRVDVHTAAIASAANIGGAASAPVVASYHNQKLVPVSILMALIGYAIGNYAAFLAAQLCFQAGRF